jgi:hypothetical protein
MKLEIILDDHDKGYFTICGITVMQDGKKLGGLTAIKIEADVDTFQPKVILKYGTGGRTLLHSIINKIFHFKSLAEELGQELKI